MNILEHHSGLGSTMDHTLALFIMEKICYIAFINRIYQNPPLSETTKTCIEAGRKLPCSLCVEKIRQKITFVAPPFPACVVPSLSLEAPSRLSKRKKGKKVSSTEKKKQAKLEEVLLKFGEKVWRAERNKNHDRTCSSYFPTPLVAALAEAHKMLKTIQDVEDLLHIHSFSFIDIYSKEIHELSTRPHKIIFYHQRIPLQSYYLPQLKKRLLLLQQHKVENELFRT